MSNIALLKMNEDEAITCLSKEVFRWAIRSSLESKLFSDETAAKAFAQKKVTDVFEQKPSMQHCFFIYDDTAGVIGRIWLTERSDKELRLAYIIIDEKFQKQGFALTAIQLLDDYAYKHNFERLSLNVFGHLDHAKRLYLKYGFKVTEEHREQGQLITTEMIKSTGQAPCNF